MFLVCWRMPGGRENDLAFDREALTSTDGTNGRKIGGLRVVRGFRIPVCRPQHWNKQYGMRTTAMKILGLYRIAAVATLLSVVHVPFAQAGGMLGNMKTDRILFLGNSITHHPPMPSIGWTGDWGMAASAESKDYVHVLQSSIGAITGHTPEVMAPINGYLYEWNYTDYDVAANLQSALDFKADIVVVAFGENVASLTSETKPLFAGSFTNLLATFRDNSDAEVFVRSRFWADPAIDGVMQQCTEAVGGVFVDQSSLCLNPWNFADVEGVYNESCPQCLSHPGDVGMKAIADSLMDAMVAHSVPEPDLLASVLGGLLSLAVYGWRGRQQNRSRSQVRSPAENTHSRFDEVGA